MIKQIRAIGRPIADKRWRAEWRVGVFLLIAIVHFCAVMYLASIAGQWQKMQTHPQGVRVQVVLWLYWVLSLPFAPLCVLALRFVNVPSSVYLASIVMDSLVWAGVILYIGRKLRAMLARYRPE
jgi:hypothetical protein